MKITDGSDEKMTVVNFFKVAGKMYQLPLKNERKASEVSKTDVQQLYYLT